MAGAIAVVVAPIVITNLVVAAAVTTTIATVIDMAITNEEKSVDDIVLVLGGRGP